MTEKAIVLVSTNFPFGVKAGLQWPHGGDWSVEADGPSDLAELAGMVPHARADHLQLYRLMEEISQIFRDYERFGRRITSGKTALAEQSRGALELLEKWGPLERQPKSIADVVLEARYISVAVEGIRAIQDHEPGQKIQQSFSTHLEDYW